MDSSDDEGVVVKHKSVRAKILDSDEDDVADQQFFLVKPNDDTTENSADTKEEEKANQESTNEKSQTSFNFLKQSDLYDAEESEDEGHFSILTEKDNSFEKTENCEAPRFQLLKDKDLYDADDSEDESPDINRRSSDVEEDVNINCGAGYSRSKSAQKQKSRPRPDRKSKTKAVQEIHSETQRLVRESRISLPYHRPRQRTLAEFLQRRQSLPAPKVKLTSDNIQEALKKIEEREKEAEIFYKSESEESDKENSCDNIIKNSEKQEEDLIKEGKDTDTAELNVFHVNELNSQVSNCSNEGAIEKTNALSSFRLSVPNDDPKLDTHLSSTNKNEKSETDNEDQGVEKTEQGTVTSDCGKVVPNSEVNSSESSVTTSENCAFRVNSFLPTVESVARNIFPNLCKDVTETNSPDKKKESEILVIDENACIDMDAVKGDSEVSAIKENVNTGPRAVEDTSDFHLHYSESQSEDVVPWYEKLKPPSPLMTDDVKEPAEKSITDDNFQSSSLENVKVSSPSTRPAEVMENSVSLEGFPENKTNDNGKQSSKLQELTRRSLPGFGDISRLKPRLSGAPNEVIDLDNDDVSESGGLAKLMQRFMKHSGKKPIPKKSEKVKIGIVTVDSQEIVHKDLMTVTLDGDEPMEDPELAKPGAKLHKLKQELQEQILQQRAEEYSRNMQEEKDEETEELSDCGLLDDEIEEEADTLTETETESEEEEEEDDVVLVDKKRVKSAFLEDEADVSDDYEPSTDEDESVCDKEADACSTVSDIVKEKSDSQSLDPEEKESTQLISDSQDTVHCNSQNASGDTENIKNSQPQDLLERVDTKSTDVIDSQSQAASEKLDTQCGAETKNPGIVDYQKAGLGRFRTFDMFLSDDDDYIPPYQIPASTNTTPSVDSQEDRRKRIQDLASPASVTTTPFSQASSRSTVDSPFSKPKKLFTEPETVNTQENMDELMNLCSGQFSGGIKKLVDSELDMSRSEMEDELLGLCSGKFATQADVSVSQATNLEGLCSGEFKSQIPDTSKIENTPQTTDDLSQSDKTVESKLHPLSFESDEEEQAVLESGTRKRRKQLHFSDEEEEDGDTDAVESDVESDATEKLVEYDSEENEVVVSKKAKEFFENEAELSESEWDSADEDEQGLDTLEWEEGDAEALDQDQLKEQLNKIHMRRQLDEDKREMRLLQEMFLEDGELHSEGGGRERKFRWKNIDNVDDSNFPRPDSDNEGGDECEIEDEEQWRRARHEREMFLQKQKKEEDDTVIDESDSQLFKLGKAALKRMSSVDKVLTLMQRSSSEVSPDPKHPFKLLTKRGSFLARGENALAKIAALTATTGNGPVTGPKNSRNFVFAAISPEKKPETEPVEVKKKREAAPIPTPPLKKPRFSVGNSRGRRLLDMLSQ